MKKMKLFPKTFLYTFFMLLFITTSMHLMIYFFYPKVYLSRMQDQLEKKMDTLQQEIKRNTAAEAGQIFSDFAKQNNVNVTVEHNRDLFGDFQFTTRGNAVQMLEELLGYISSHGLPKAYILIDEYDNFTNQLLTSYNDSHYEEVTTSDSFLLTFFKVII
jgi:hypothetical protein